LVSIRNCSGYFEKKSTQLLINAQYEFASKTFKPLERYRPVEFERDWNLQTASSQTFNENLGAISFNLQKFTVGNVQYAVSFFNRELNYTGLNNSINGNYLHKGFHVSWATSYLISKSDSLTHAIPTTFIRCFTINQNFGEVLRLVFTVNKSTIKFFFPILIRCRRQVLITMMRKFISRALDTTKFRYSIDASSRIDYAPIGSSFLKATQGNTANLNAGLFKNPNSILQITATYRELKISDTHAHYTKARSVSAGKSDV